MKVCGRSVISRRISRKCPDAASRPDTITSTFVARSFSSSRMCELMTIDAPRRGEASQHVHHVQTLARIHAVERLVEQQNPRIVHERTGDLDALPHPLRVRADLPVLRDLEIDERDRLARPRRSTSASCCRRALTCARTRSP